jgi:heptosyltransferase II
MRSSSPNSLALVCRHGLGHFFLKAGLVDEVFEIKKGDAASYQEALNKIRTLNLDEVYVPHQSYRTHLFVSKLRARNKIGFSSWWNFLFFNHRIKRDGSLPDAIRQLSLMTFKDPQLKTQIDEYKRQAQAYAVSPQGQMSPPPSWASMSIRENLLADKSTWSRWLDRSGMGAKRNKPWVLIFPGSVWATKRWSEKGFAEVAKGLVQSGKEVLLMGAPDERELCSRIHAQVPHSHLLAGETSVYESALIMVHSDLAIGNDSASMHLASAAETPLVTLFGPTVIEFGYRPWSERAYIVQSTGLSCRPCGPHGHQKCPLGTHICMKEISPQKVLEVTQNIL